MKRRSKEGITPVNNRSHILWWFNVELDLSSRPSKSW
ncbi:hypothetical protein SLEP1_g44403 [Rubroshorea leprosula]|uniref:Ycf15 n=1 Tax=Rubroshorea leprosula TaxID=152421 RepID=A0AAV5LGP3_9ROSI|nr:hypothetical protein SLEP1_g44403 [Rubroshorea leprosula]